MKDAVSVIQSCQNAWPLPGRHKKEYSGSAYNTRKTLPFLNSIFRSLNRDVAHNTFAASLSAAQSLN